MPSIINIIALALVALALVSTILGDSLIFDNRSDRVYWIDFTPNEDGTNGIGDVRVDPHTKYQFPMDGYGPEWNRNRGWRGNFRAQQAGVHDPDHSVWGEVCFHCDDSNPQFTTFDVSVVHGDGNQQEGIHWVYPANDPGAGVSGCDHFPCPTCYVHEHDDWETRTTTSNDIIVEIRNS